MNIRKTLTAYLDDTLSPEEKLNVSRRLMDSAKWQDELYALQQIRRQLNNEMPLLGYNNKNLNNLLPSILEQSRPKLDFRLFLKSVLLGSTVLALVVVVVAGFMHMTTAQAAVNDIGNVPSSTSTPNVNQSDITAEPAQNSIVFRINRETANITINKSLSISLFASPVPMPLATMEPSLEAPSQPSE